MAVSEERKLSSERNFGTKELSQYLWQLAHGQKPDQSPTMITLQLGYAVEVDQQTVLFKDIIGGMRQRTARRDWEQAVWLHTDSQRLYPGQYFNWDESDPSRVILIPEVPPPNHKIVGAMHVHRGQEKEAGFPSFADVACVATEKNRFLTIVWSLCPQSTFPAILLATQPEKPSSEQADQIWMRAWKLKEQFSSGPAPLYLSEVVKYAKDFGILTFL